MLPKAGLLDDLDRINLSYIWKSPIITPKPLQQLPLTKYFPDVGYVVSRTGWSQNDPGI